VQFWLHYARTLGNALQFAKEVTSTPPIVLGKIRSPGLAPFAIIRSRSLSISAVGNATLRPCSATACIFSARRGYRKVR
jgi:hypothetical protein